MKVSDVLVAVRVLMANSPSLDNFIGIDQPGLTAGPAIPDSAHRRVHQRESLIEAGAGDQDKFQGSAGGRDAQPGNRRTGRPGAIPIATPGNDQHRWQSEADR